MKNNEWLAQGENKNGESYINESGELFSKINSTYGFDKWATKEYGKEYHLNPVAQYTYGKEQLALHMLKLRKIKK